MMSTHLQVNQQQSREGIGGKGSIVIVGFLKGDILYQVRV